MIAGWKSLRRRVWERDGGICQRCREHVGDRLYEVHHIANQRYFPELVGDPENLTLLCNPCHNWVHSNENVDREFLRVHPDMPDLGSVSTATSASRAIWVEDEVWSEWVRCARLESVRRDEDVSVSQLVREAMEEAFGYRMQMQTEGGGR